MIKVLEKNIADKIAAGEVIERPVSIVKELVENSLDAGAKNITVEIKNGGKSLIRVTDDGAGIHKAEVKTAFLRHATSKIETVSDLNSINTLGFRGEALASIVSVTHTEFITKPKDQKLGTKTIIRGSEIITFEDTGCPDGTTVVVKDLFYNTPARLKFLKADNTESSLIIEFLSEVALAYKDVRFRVINNEKVLFSTLGDGNRLNTIIRIFPDVDSKNLVSMDEAFAGLKVSGYISTPAMSKNTRSSEIFFVNGRVVNSKVIEKGINLGYKERLFDGRFPICYLFLEVDPSTLDVNIHPNKREVRFDAEDDIVKFISESIKKTLSKKEALVDASNIFKDKKESPVLQQSIKKEANFVSKEEKNEKFVINEKIEQINVKYLLSTIDNINSDQPNIVIEESSNKPFDFKDLKVSGIIFDTYITAIDSDNFYIIDQHAAQERIFYEKLISEYENVAKNRQTLLLPIMINVSVAENIDNSEWLKSLGAMGFEIHEFGSGTYRITEIPMFMDTGEADRFVREFIDNIKNSTDLRNTVVVNKIIMLSCKSAIKAHDKLTLEEVNALMKDLSNCKNPYSCPHGRPTVIKLTQYEIEKMFKRV